jgi:hypothetical protein
VPYETFAWGKKGHQLVAEVAFHFLDSATRAAVLKDLGHLSFEEASTWMDDMRSDHFYDYMRTWHYLDLDKDSVYHPTAERNILTILHSAIRELEHKDMYDSKRVRNDLLYLFHLIGDLHQPLHVGYPGDKGGNDVTVGFVYKSYSTNLHTAWDSEIIDFKKISLNDCLQQYDSLSQAQIDSLQKINVFQWMKQSRSLLDDVYDFKDGFLDQAYVDHNTPVIEKQIMIAGLRLATVLKEVYKSK